MKLKDITIGIRLILAFSVIVILVTVTAIVSYNHSKKLWTFTADLYDHPLQTSRSVRDIKADIIAMHRSVKDMILADDDTEFQKAIVSFRTTETNVEKSFEAVYNSYLGDRSDIDTVFRMFREWITITDETRRLLINGEVQAAEDRTKSTGAGGAHVEKMMREINKLVDFAKTKGDNFYSSAAASKKELDNRLLVLLISVYLLTVTIAILIVKAIRQPLKELTEIADLFRKGNYNIRSDYTSGNEIGVLASSFNSMASSVQNDIIVKENAALLSQLMMNENELRPFCRGLLNALISKTESQIAAVYLLNKNTGKFEHFESIGLSADKIRDFSALSSEGEFGTALTDKNIGRITNIPEDTLFIFSAVAGNFKPHEILTVPVIENSEVIAIISLASLKKYSELSVRLINEIWALIAARLIGVINFQKIKDFSSVLDIQNKELDQKSKELILQSDELKEYNIELEIQKKQLDESNKLKSAFLSNMSHELRTPLNSVIALSGVLNKRLKGMINEEEHNYIGIIEKNGKNLLILINNILDLSRIESGREEISTSRFQVSDLINEITGLLEPVSSVRGISVTSQIADDLPLIISDRSKFFHIMQNIISNAVKFTEEGHVKITAWSEGANLHVSVTDSGIGIPESFLPFVFDEFRQADDKASRKFGGTGLGLAIVKKYCQLLNGSIDVKSKQGEGSTFTVILPLRLSELKVSSDENELHSEYRNRKNHIERAEMSGKGKTLLLVEDSEPQIIQLTEILKEEGFTIQVARNGREALESINFSIPDAMILDLQMPEVDGFEVLRLIRNLEATRSVPVLILTAKHISKADLSFLKENNIHQLIQKGSVNRNDLLDIINNLFNPKLNTSEKMPAIGKPQSNHSHKESILVIEDNEDNLITVSALLSQNFVINSAADWSEGFVKATSEIPDLILLDISLPGKDGFKVLDEIRNNINLKGIPVIALTARAMKGDREELLAYGFDGYISKPIDNETFEKLIIEYLKLKTFPNEGKRNGE